LLGNDCEISKYTIGEVVFSVRFVPRCYKRDIFGAAVNQSVKRRVEAWELDGWSNGTFVGYSPAGKDISRGH
jgi:hypothetical protein